MELFGTAGIRGSVADRVTPALALSVGQAVGTGPSTVVVGRDGRRTGPALAAAVEAGVESAGGDVVRVGQVPTPALAFASRGRHGVMLTASHNPPQDNGIKVFADGVEIDGETERAVEGRVAGGDGPPADWDRWGEPTSREVLPSYREGIVAFAGEHGATPENTRVVVDCGNGVGALATPQVLDRLGAPVTALNATVDGRFTARESKPTAESLADLRGFVADDPDAVVGFGHDGDADRIVGVDADGEVVHEDTVVAILAEHYVRTSDAADPVVVTTPNASGRIDERVGAAGGRVERVALGYLHEGIAETRAAGDDGTEVVFAAEPWKHVHTALGGWIDAVASAAVLTRLVAAEGLAALREPVTERPYEKGEVACPDDAKAATMDRLAETLPAALPEAEATFEHGVRLTFPEGGWTLVRPSGTEPYVRVYVESEDVASVLASVREVVEDAVADQR